MSRFRKICLLLILSMSLTLSSACGEKEDSGSTPPTSENISGEIETEQITTLSELEERSAIDDELPDITFDGADFRILMHSDSAHYLMEMVAESETGDVINDAVYKRNREIEARFNLNFKTVHAGSGSMDVVNMARKSIKSGDDAYDLIVSHAIRTGATVTEGLYVDWYDVPNVDFDKPWWNTSAMEHLTVGSHAYLALGDFNTSALTGTYCIFFNKNLAADLAIAPDSLYKTVLDGQWTMDKLYDYSREAYRDLNGNSSSDKEDQFGLIANANSPAVAFLWSSNHPLTKSNSDGYPELTLNVDKMTTIVDSVYNLYYNNQGAYVCANNDTENADMFNTGKNLFVLNTLGASFQHFRNTPFDYGIIPYPKLNESQDKYYTMADGFHSLLCVPKTSMNLDFVGVVSEALNAYSYKEVVPQYYEVALKVKYTHDNESVQILDTITEGTVYDFGYFYDDWTGFAFMLQDLMKEKSPNFASYYEKRYDNALKQFEKVYNAYLNLED